MISWYIIPIILLLIWLEMPPPPPIEDDNDHGKTNLSPLQPSGIAPGLGPAKPQEQGQGDGRSDEPRGDEEPDEE